MYACTFGDQTELPDMACINWPGTFQCVDSAVMNGGNSKSWHMMNALNRDYYQDSLTKCTGHELPNLSINKGSSVYVNNYLFTCGGHDTKLSRDSRFCSKINLDTKGSEPVASMNRFRRHMTLNYAEDKIYAIGGYNHNGDVDGNPAINTESETPCQANLEAYDIELNTWTMMSGFFSTDGIHR